MAARTGQLIGKYTVVKALGSGAMATVYQVTDPSGASWAMKVLDAANREIASRMEREGRVQGSLETHNVVGVHEVFEHNKQPVLVMELITGADLEELVLMQRPDLDEALAVFGGILEGVRTAHRKGVTHRDLKPANVMMHVSDGTVTPKVADFGLAKAAAGESSADPATATRDGATMGTPRYMAPEQIRDAKRADARADIFSLGAILYELVTGKQAFSGTGILEIFKAVSAGDYPRVPTVAPGTPAHIVAAIDKCLLVDPDARPQTCDELATMLFGSTSGFATDLSDTTRFGQVAVQLLGQKQGEEVEVAGGTFALDFDEVAQAREELEEERAAVAVAAAAAPSMPAPAEGSSSALIFGAVAVAIVVMCLLAVGSIVTIGMALLFL